MSLDELKNLIKGGVFHNPTKGQMNLGGVVNELINYKEEDPQARYKVVIGTDSEQKEKGSDFVCVVAVLRIGRGGRYFWLRIYDQRKLDLRTRIYQEATISLALAGALLEKELKLHQKLEIHVDIGSKGPTKEMIKEIVGMIKGSGFYVRIKPEAFAAATLADKHL